MTTFAEVEDLVAYMFFVVVKFQIVCMAWWSPTAKYIGMA